MNTIAAKGMKNKLNIHLKSIWSEFLSSLSIQIAIQMKEKIKSKIKLLTEISIDIYAEYKFWINIFYYHHPIWDRMSKWHSLNCSKFHSGGLVIRRQKNYSNRKWDKRKTFDKVTTAENATKNKEKKKPKKYYWVYLSPWCRSVWTKHCIQICKCAWQLAVSLPIHIWMDLFVFRPNERKKEWISSAPFVRRLIWFFLPSFLHCSGNRELNRHEKKKWMLNEPFFIFLWHLTKVACRT